MPPDPVVVSSYARTPMGAFQGTLSSVAATGLSVTAVQPVASGRRSTRTGSMRFT